MADTLLKGEALTTGYDGRLVLDHINMEILPGEIVAVIGHNGAGKSTLLKSIFSLVPLWTGTIYWKNSAVAGLSTQRLRSLGIAYVPQGNRVFNTLRVVDNFKLAAPPLATHAFRAKLDEILSLFPALTDRLDQQAGTLSGGEKQMVALGCGLIIEPHLLLLDEPSLGLAPNLIGDIFEKVRMIASSRNTAFLIVEQKVRHVLRISERTYVLRRGKVVFAGSSTLLQDEARLRQAYL